MHSQEQDMTLGERVRQIRHAQGISQERFAEKAGVGRITIQRLEAGAQRNVSLVNTARIARAFGLTIDELLKGVDVEPEGMPALA
jgi:transcriptional regulator with XRE-family HTH domain